MATTIFRNKNLVRPKKVGAAKRQKLKAQRNRLVAYGVDAQKVTKMTSKEIREMLKYPAKLAKAN